MPPVTGETLSSILSNGAKHRYGSWRRRSGDDLQGHPKKMKKLDTFTEAHQKVLDDTKRSLETIRRLSSLPCETTEEGIDILSSLRQESYEDLNQIQHEHLIIKAAEWLSSDGRFPAGVEWSWNPRQTGDSSEPDLRGTRNGEIVLSAEVTTSARPVGTIDARMQKTLAKLAQMQGMKFYFVRSEEMCQRAATKVAKGGWSIAIVRLAAI
ncbi:hypothetical protein [Paraburkholderia sp. MM6662-R1]|uniref:hypothetical protein n=1 Tax=Paraburkholderia sp. MM6662-R1 TaxID=2991066 RepID=UPI003D258BBC